jgi:hypothetical protein
MDTHGTGTAEIDPTAPPSGTGCVDCEATGSWWLHLRRCAACGHVGCCDDSLNRHARAHFEQTGHPIIQSFEPGEEWFYNWRRDIGVRGMPLAPPTSHPQDQTVPGPAARVPEDWQQVLQDAAESR